MNNFLIAAGFILISFSSFAQETLKVMYYNMLKYPTSLIDRGDTLKRIIQYVDPDIFVIEELASLNGALNIMSRALNVDGVTKYQRSDYENANGWDTDNMLFYNSQKLGLLEQNNISTNLRALSEYILYYKDPNLSQTNDTIKLYVYACHFKAGNGTTEAQMRYGEAQSLKSYMTNHSRNQNIIVGGDFNLYNASEDAYTELLTGGTTDLNDPVNQFGAWHNNYNFSSVHTQSTRSSSQSSPGGGSTGGLDDRFDFIMVSDDIMNGSQGIKYVLNSYKALGQDGNHFNDGVNEGYNSSVSQDLANALFYVSDHLPVIMDIQIGGPLSTQQHENILNYFLYNANEKSLNVALNKNHDKVELEIYDTAGKLIFNKTIHNTQNFTEYLYNLTGGMYIVSIIADGMPVSGKIMVY